MTIIKTMLSILSWNKGNLSNNTPLRLNLLINGGTIESQIKLSVCLKRTSESCISLWSSIDLCLETKLRRGFRKMDFTTSKSTAERLLSIAWTRPKGSFMRWWKKCLDKWFKILSISKGQGNSHRSFRVSITLSLKLCQDKRSTWISWPRKTRWG